MLTFRLLLNQASPLFGSFALSMGVNIMLQKSTDSYVQNKLSRTSTTILYRYHSIYKLHLKCIYHLPSWTFLVEVVLDGGRGGVDPEKGAKTDRQSVDFSANNEISVESSLNDLGNLPAFFEVHSEV